MDFALWVKLHDASVFWMTCLIWVVQLNVYPLFYAIEGDQFNKLHEQHSNRIAWLVSAPMFLQLGISAFLAYTTNESGWIYRLSNAVFLFLITGFHSVPCHHKLARGKNLALIGSLIQGNWWRVVLWTCGGIDVIWRLEF